MEVKIEKSWKKVLKDEFEKQYFVELTSFVREEYINRSIYPKPEDIFRAFDDCPFTKLKVVILGQDPYHTPGVANGLAFSSNLRTPPSLQNIYKELRNDIGKEIPKSADLTDWAKEGVLLLNATLTVEKGKPGSHQNKGWEIFTDNVIKIISSEKKNIVFILWGAYAGKKEILIDKTKHLIIKSAHPSPFSADRGFFGSRPFSSANEYLVSCGLKPIDW